MPNIIDVAFLKSDLGIPAGITFHDVALSYAVDYGNSYVLGRLGQSDLAVETRTEYPSVAAQGKRRVLLKRSPVVSIVAVTNGSAAVAAADYRLDTDTDELVLVYDRFARSGGAWSSDPDGVVVTYTWGYTATTLPAKVRQATAQIAAAVYLKTKHAGKRDERNSSYSITLSEREIPPEAQMTLAGLADVHHD